MRSFISKVRNAFSFQSPRDAYLRRAVDLADLEFRQENWDRMQRDLNRHYLYSRF